MSYKPRVPPKIIDGILYYRCSYCLEYKAADDFYKRKVNSANGERPVSYDCKSCNKERTQSRHRTEYMQKYKREWAARKREEYFIDKECDECGEKSDLGVVSLIPGKKYHPWYGKKHYGVYKILCKRHIKRFNAERQSAYTKKMWREGRLDHIIPLLSQKMSDLWAQGFFDHIPQCQPGYVHRGKYKTHKKRAQKFTPEALSENYPYIPTQEDYTDWGVELLLSIGDMLPKGLPNDVKGDLGQNIALSILDKEYSLEDFKDINLLKKFITKAWKEAPSQFMISLDAPMFKDDENGTAIIERITQDDILR